VRLTSRNVRSLEPGEYRDPQVPGLILRVWDTGRAWGFRYTFQGERRREDLGAVEQNPKKLAAHIEATRDLARLLVAGMVRGEDPRVTLRRHEHDGLTVSKVCAKAMEALTLRPATREGWAGHIKRDIEPTLGEIPAAALSRDTIRKWGQAIAARSGYSANRAFEVLRRAYSFAVENDFLTATPFVRLPKPFSGEAPREHVMTVDEIAGLVQALDAEPCGYANAVELLLLTGVRKEEVRGARVGEISGDLWRVPAARTKNAAEHLVPLSRQALDVISRQKATHRSPQLFPRVYTRRKGEPPKSPAFRLGSKYVDRLRGKTGGRWTIHGFRHALATHGQDILGFELSVVSAILGHVTPETSKATRVYARGKQLEARRDALQSWADWLDTLRWRPRTGPKVAQ
jgi:integrase